MGLFSTSKSYSTIVNCQFPGYVLKNLGLRHFLLAGGGGAAKTGVRNEIQLFLLTYNQCSSLASSNGALPELRAKLTNTVDTGLMASMNADVLELNNDGRYLVAVGQDKYCSLYKTNGYELGGDEDEVESPSRLTLNLQSMHQLLTDNSTKDPYQKCVRFDRSGVKPLRLATGGMDGHVRIWNVQELLDSREPPIEVSAINEFHLNGGEVDDLDFSFCGTTLATVTHKETLFWNIDRGTSMVLPTPERIGNNFRVRSIRFTTLGRNNIVFAVAYQQRQRTSKQTSFISLWSFNRERGTFNLVNLNQIKDAAISNMAVSPDKSAFIACGSMEGHVYCFETANLQCVYTALECHKSFVTSVEFLPSRELIKSDVNQRRPPQMLPGPGCEAMASLISLSVDQTINFHSVSFPQGESFTSQMLKLSAQLLFLYVLLYFLFVY